MNTYQGTPAAKSRVAEITEEQFIAWLKDRRAELAEKFGDHSSTVSISATRCVGLDAHYYFTVHACGECYGWPDLPLAQTIQRLEEKITSPDERTKELRSKAKRLLDKVYELELAP